MNLTPQQKQELADLAPSIEFTLDWMVRDYMNDNRGVAISNLSQQMQIAIELNDLLKEVLE